MNRFFVDKNQIEESQIMLNGSDVNHIKNVLRLEKNDKIIICDGQGNDYYCIINTVTNDKIIAKIDDVYSTKSELKSQIYLFQGLPKKDKMDLIVQKAVELGVYKIIPVNTKRTIVKFDAEKQNKKIQRWKIIAEAAAKQSGRGIIPKINTIMSYKKALDYATSLGVNLIPYEKAKNINKTRSIINNIDSKSIGVFIGPEGGFEEDEIDQAISFGVTPISLGKRILRTETAGLALLSALMISLEED
ncbi:MAG: 16S rRNA (uracil(1498)-N(3))-methyltransferase [Eubacteriales bacterium]